jgi:hypothetical protein
MAGAHLSHRPTTGSSASLENDSGFKTNDRRSLIELASGADSPTPRGAAATRTVWLKPVLVSTPIALACVGVTVQLHRGWTSFGTDFSRYTILLDVRVFVSAGTTIDHSQVVFSAMGVVLVKVLQSAYTGFVSEYHRTGRRLGEKHSQCVLSVHLARLTRCRFYAAQACHIPFKQSYYLFWLAYLALLVSPFVL